MSFVFSSADILLPKTDMEKWAVIACDQFTSEPEYWEKVEKIAANSPSAYNVILPEVYLKDDNTEKIETINSNMKKYLKNGIFEEYKDAMILVDRTTPDNRHRFGIIGKVDLEEYDYSKNSVSAVRATEKTVVERIPPRAQIRQGAPIELPHAILLLDDKDCMVVEKAEERKSDFLKLYDFDLMLGGGHICGYLLDNAAKEGIISALKGLSQKQDGFLFSVGDGNHSLASAKECYNKEKNEKTRYALVEIENIHSPALTFEPIYRIVKCKNPEKLIEDFCKENYKGDDAQEFLCVKKTGEKKIFVKPTSKTAVGTLQNYLDGLKEDISLDYIHGKDSLRRLVNDDNTVGFIFNGIKKDELFPSVAADGSLPRKTFSMGQAFDKRFYIEARKIK